MISSRRREASLLSYRDEDDDDNDTNDDDDDHGDCDGAGGRLRCPTDWPSSVLSSYDYDDYDYNDDGDDDDYDDNNDDDDSKEKGVKRQPEVSHTSITDPQPQGPIVATLGKNIKTTKCKSKMLEDYRTIDICLFFYLFFTSH